MTKKGSGKIPASFPGQLSFPARVIQIRRKKILPAENKSFPRHVLRGVEPRIIQKRIALPLIYRTSYAGSAPHPGRDLSLHPCSREYTFPREEGIMVEPKSSTNAKIET